MKNISALRCIGVLLCSVNVAGFHCPNTTTAIEILAGQDLSGQTYVITGGDSGIGYATAMALAAKNATVVLGCRGTDGKYARAVENITRATQNSKVYIVKLDLSSFTSVRSFVADLLRRAPVINALVCNAGIADNPASLPSLTEDGFERVFQVNFLSHFLLVEELLPSLRRSRGRVVHVSSVGSFFACQWADRQDGCMSLDNLPPAVPQKGDVPGFPGSLPYTNYGVTKYMQVFHAAELARRESIVSAYSLMPGLVESGMTDWWAKQACHGLKNCPLTAEEGAATSAYIATTSIDELRGDNGKYFLECEPSTSVRSIMMDGAGEAATLQYQKQFYDLCLKWSKATSSIVV